MATFTYNNGAPQAVSLSGQEPSAGISLTVAVAVADTNTRIAGHTIINLNGTPIIEDVQFENHPLATVQAIAGERLVVMVNVSKFTMAAANVAAATTTATCTVSLSAAGATVSTYQLDDSTYSENNSIFVYLFSF